MLRMVANVLIENLIYYKSNANANFTEIIMSMLY